MKTQSLAEFNPYLKGKQPLAAVFARTVESSTAIEGVHIKLAAQKFRASAGKRKCSSSRAKPSR
jgi:hypothetical protein